jgi:2,5-dihydroxypyridine 5,6-dioxygenase
LAAIPALKEKVLQGTAMFQAASVMRVTSKAGTDLTIDVKGARTTGGWGFCDTPGRIDHWPGGLVVGWPRPSSVNGTLVLDRGDVNLTFKKYLESPVALTFENDYAVRIDGDGVDAELTRSYLAAWGDRNVYGSAHVGWGMNPKARWETLVAYDRRDVHGTEQRAFAGNFMFSTGANKMAGRYTLGHFDLPMRNCTVMLDDRVVVDQGRLLPPLTLDAEAGIDA